MDSENFQRRRNKSQRAKEEYDRFGKFTAKHLRTREALMTRVQGHPQDEARCNSMADQHRKGPCKGGKR